MLNPYRALRGIARIVRSTPLRYMHHLVAVRTERRVQQGPFAGMRYVERSYGSQWIPKLLGIYERELNACIERACAAAFPLIVDIGAAEGYYAVGMARRNPHARVVAFEMVEAGRNALRELATLNGVEPAQLELRGRCELEDLKAILPKADRFLIICDAEGDEDRLLVPDQISALARATLLVETHDFCVPGISERLMRRFEATHTVRRIWQENRDPSDFPFRSFGTAVLPRFYRAWAVSEWRPERMSWLWMEPLVS